MASPFERGKDGDRIQPYPGHPADSQNTIQSRLEGLELGADAYLDKPFSTNLLMAQISNLISNRDNIRKFYFNSPIANMKSMAYTKRTKVFWKS